MAFVYIDTDYLPSDFTLLVENGNTTQIAPDTRIQTDDANNVRLGSGISQTSLINDGRIIGVNSNAAVEIQSSDSILRNTGMIANYAPNAADVAVQYDTAGTHSLFNSGTLLSAGRLIEALGPTLASVDLTVTNTGHMESLNTQPIIAASIAFSSVSLVNTGTIIGGVLAFASEGQSLLDNSGEIYSTRLIGDSTEGFTLNNTGLIRNATSASTLQTEIVGADGTFGDALTNHGQIYATIDLQSGADQLYNHGQLTGDLDMGDGNDALESSDLITGDVFLGAGNDRFHKVAGRISGIVDGGAGNDTYVLNVSGVSITEAQGGGTDHVLSSVSHRLAENVERLTLTGSTDINGSGNASANTMDGNAGNNRISGSGGKDTIFGAAGDDRLFGGQDADNLNGGDGDDHLSGGSGADSLLGSDGDDDLFGRRGFDTLFGEDGADWLDGGNGDDHLNGGREDDVLIGGAGQDVLEGGGGLDLFIWRSTGESPDKGAHDIVVDFETGLDRIDLTALHLDTINLNSGFSGGGISSLRTHETNAGSTRLFADTNGDGSGDFRIDLANATGVTLLDILI